VLLAGLGAAAWWMMSRRSSGVEEWDVDDYTEESLYYDDDQFNVDRGNRFANVVRDNPVPIALTTIGIGWWMWNRRTGSRQVTYGSGYPAASFDSTWDARTGYGAAGAEAGTYRRFDSDRGVWVGGEEGEGTSERVKHAVSDASDRARETLSSATGRARETMEDVSGRTRQAASRAQQQIGQYSRQAKSQLQYWMEENPLAVGAVAMAVGAAVGLALPETRREQELMGDARDRMVDNAKSMANTAVDRATEAAQNLVGTAKDAADTTSSSANTAQDAISRASQAAKNTINKATD
jgi:vacuolar-type H+-ATPase subunit H